jgi:AraC-like DNA-binding protein
MRFNSYKPKGAISRCVENFWLYEGYEGEHANERILPTGTIELVINLREDELRIYDADQPEKCSRFSGAVVSGAYRKGFISDSDEEGFIIGIHFKPGGAFPFLDVPVHEIADAHLDLELLWGYSAKLLREQLCEATTAQARFELLESALTDHVCHPFEPHYAVASALEAFGKRVDVGVRDVAKETGLSHRRFSQLFKREVGMTPKLFSRVQRFQQTRSAIHQHDAGAVDWADTAMECGYSDQSHMIREFLEFSGMSPEAYLRQYRRFLAQQTHLKRYHFPVSSKAGQFYPIQNVSSDEIVALGGNYVCK